MGVLPYILQNQHSYTNALHDALNEFDRLELIKNRKSFQSGLDDLTGFFTLK
jgi:hypothetical protein